MAERERAFRKCNVRNFAPLEYRRSIKKRLHPLSMAFTVLATLGKSLRLNGVSEHNKCYQVVGCRSNIARGKAAANVLLQVPPDFIAMVPEHNPCRFVLVGIAPSRPRHSTEMDG